jgi:RHS repeat-associated protein
MTGHPASHCVREIGGRVVGSGPYRRSGSTGTELHVFTRKHSAFTASITRWLRVALSVQLVLVQVAPALAHTEPAAATGTPPPPSPTESVEYYGYDAVGSLRVVFAPEGTVLQRADYLPCGELLAAASSPPPEGFAGKPRDTETDLDYSIARFYRPQFGRFTSADAADPGATGDPQRWNRYSYALNNPLSYSDPSGLTPYYQTGPVNEVVNVTAPFLFWQTVATEMAWLDMYGGSGAGPGRGRPGPGGGQRPNQPAPPAKPTEPTQEEPAPPPVPPTPPTNNNGEKKAFEDGFKEAVNRLKKPDCANIYGGWNAAVAGLGNANWRFTGYTRPSIDAQGNVSAIGAYVTHGGGGATVSINSNGPFVNMNMMVLGNSGVTVRRVDNGYHALNQTEFRGLLMLHELGHVVGVFGSDASNPTLNKSYSDTVYKACF